jgi:hypothetical protein
MHDLTGRRTATLAGMDELLTDHVDGGRLSWLDMVLR